MKNKFVSVVMDILYLSIGVGATVTSIKFSYQFFVYNGHSVFWSMVVAVTYIVFLNLIFEASINCFIVAGKIKREKRKYKEKKNKKILTISMIKKIFIGVIIFISWFILVFYSIISTVGGQYEQLSKLQLDKKEAVKMTNDQIPLLQDKIDILMEQKTSYDKEIYSINTKLSSIEDIEKSANYRSTRKNLERRMDEKQLKSEKKSNEILDLKDQILEIKLNSNTIEKGNTYSYFESIIKVPAFIIQFILSFFPSIVIDFFAPIGFAMFLFRKRKN